MPEACQRSSRRSLNWPTKLINTIITTNDEKTKTKILDTKQAWVSNINSSWRQGDQINESDENSDAVLKHTTLVVYVGSCYVGSCWRVVTFKTFITTWRNFLAYRLQRWVRVFCNFVCAKTSNKTHFQSTKQSGDICTIWNGPTTFSKWLARCVHILAVIGGTRKGTAEIKTIKCGNFS